MIFIAVWQEHILCEQLLLLTKAIVLFLVKLASYKQKAFMVAKS
jgi:hypothetical protein